MRISDWSSDVCSSDLPIIYLNRVGGQDELVFDGASFILSAEGDVVHRLPEWGEAIVQTHWSRNMHGRWVCAPGERAVADPYPEDIYSAMVLGLRDYVNRNRFPGVVLGLSGGIRSEEHTSELQALMRISYAVFCLKTKTKTIRTN